MVRRRVRGTASAEVDDDLEDSITDLHAMSSDDLDRAVYRRMASHIDDC